MKKITAVILVLFSFSIYLSAQNNLTSLQLIELDHQNGLLNNNEALLQKLYSLHNSPELNKKYVSDIPSKCGTEISAEYYRRKITLDEVTLNKAEALFSEKRNKRIAEMKYYSPSGKFELNYSTDGINAVPAEDIDNNNVPDYVEKIAGYFDYVWSFTIDSMGYNAPALVNGLYIIEFENMEYYGYTDVVNYSEPATKIVMNNTFNGFPENDDPEGSVLGAAKVTAIHEFKHAVQFTYNRWREESWLLEMDATWIEDIGYDQVNDYYSYLNSSQIVEPGRSLNDSDGYEDCIFMHYLTQKLGNQFNMYLWNERKNNADPNIFTCFENVLNQYGTSLSETIPEYFVWNYLCGNKLIAGVNTYEEAENYPAPAICSNVYNFPDAITGCQIKYYGANNIVFNNFDFDAVFSFNINIINDPFTVAIISKSINSTPEVSYFNPSSTDKVFKLNSKMSELENLIIIPIVNSATDLDYSYDMNFKPFISAEFTHTPFKDTEQITDITINVKVETPFNIAKTDSLKLFWSADGIIYENSLMIPVNDKSEFTAVIPLTENNVRIFYYFSIYDTTGVYLFHPIQGPANPFTFFVGSDSVPPTVQLYSVAQELSKYNFPHMIAAKISDNISLDSCYVSLRINDGAEYKVPMNLTTDSVYSAELNPLAGEISENDVINYRIKAVDGSSMRNVAYYPEDGYSAIKIVEGFMYSSSPYLFIPDNNFPSEKDTIIINDDFIIDDFDILIEFEHNRLSDLEVKLKTPFSSSKSLFERPGFDTDFLPAVNPKIMLDQSAAFSIENSIPVSSGLSAMYCRPLNIDFDSFIGSNAKGGWILSVYDKETGEQGFLKNWAVILRRGNTTFADRAAGVNYNYVLENNYPNPFNPTTKISYEIAEQGFAELSVYDVLGNKVQTLASGYHAPGRYTINFNGSNLASGVYFYTLKTNGYNATKKLLLLK